MASASEHVIVEDIAAEELTRLEFFFKIGESHVSRNAAHSL